MNTARPAFDIDSLLAEPNPERAARALIEAVQAARRDGKLIGHERVIYHPYQVHCRVSHDGIGLTLFNLGLARFYWA
ncbi:MAG TPA: hypothetical protein VG167_05040 [Verrucomicrobiae bacterium]|nr:hypothetical protein [Verrucomicrobiae bacterium]